MRALPPRSHYGYVPLLGRLPIEADGAADDSGAAADGAAAGTVAGGGKAGGGEASGSESGGSEVGGGEAGEGDAYQPWLRLRSRVRGDEATDDVAVRMG